jgi:hypothetical protein
MLMITIPEDALYQFLHIYKVTKKMTDFTDSLITNLGVYSSSPVMTSVNMVQLGEKLRQARISALTSLSQALSKNINYSVNTAIPTDTATDTTVNATLPLPATEKASGQLELYVLEGRNLTIADASKSDTYCIVHYEKNVTSTLDRMDDVILPNAPFVLKPNTDGGAFKAFEIMVRASSPKWMHRVKL